MNVRKLPISRFYVWSPPYMYTHKVLACQKAWIRNTFCWTCSRTRWGIAVGTPLLCHGKCQVPLSCHRAHPGWSRRKSNFADSNYKAASQIDSLFPNPLLLLEGIWWCIGRTDRCRNSKTSSIVHRRRGRNASRERISRKASFLLCRGVKGSISWSLRCSSLLVLGHKINVVCSKSLCTNREENVIFADSVRFPGIAKALCQWWRIASMMQGMPAE